MTIATRIIRRLTSPLVRAAIMKGLLFRKISRLRSCSGKVEGKVRISEAEKP